MKYLIVVALLSMALVQMGNLGALGYVPVMGSLLLIFVLNQRVYLSGDLWYNLGGGLCLAGMALGSILHGNTVSYGYIFFGTVLFFFYPIFRQRGIERYLLMFVFWVLAITVMPVSLNQAGIDHFYDNPNNYSGVVLCTMFLGMVVYYDSWWKQLLIYAVAIGLVLLGASRSILGAVLIFGMLYVGQRYVLRRHLRAVLAVGFLVMCFAYYTLITDDRFKLMETVQQTTVSEHKKERGLSHRDALFYISLNIARDFPEGVGMGLSNREIGKRYLYAYTPHNTFMKALVEGGWLMFAGLLILVLGYFSTNSSYLASSFLFTLCIRGLFESSTPFSVSLISTMLVLVMFLDERSVKMLSDLTITLPRRTPPVIPESSDHSPQ